MSLKQGSQTPQCPWNKRVRLHNVPDMRSQTPQCPWNKGVRLHNVLDTRESDSTMSLTQASQTPQCPWHKGVRLHNVPDTRESDSTMSLTQGSQTPRCPWHEESDYTESLTSLCNTESLTKWSQTLQCHWLWVVKLCGVMEAVYKLCSVVVPGIRTVNPWNSVNKMLEIPILNTVHCVQYTNAELRVVNTLTVL